MAKEKVFFPNLDGLRFIAFFLVFIQHGFGNTIKTLGLQISDNHLLRVFEAGGAGVSFFFVLSGFLITYLILSEIELNGRVDIIAFYIRRGLRIFPLYFITIFWGIVFYPLIKTFFGFYGYVEFGNPLFYFLFLSNFDVINLQHAGLGGAMSTNITWSVAIEEQFYLGWVILFYTLKPRFYKYLFPTVILASLFFRILNRDDESVLYFHTFSVISDMALGGGCAYLTIKYAGFKEFFHNLNRNWVIFFYFLGVTLFFFETELLASWISRLVLTFFYAFIILEQNYAQNSIYKMKNSKTLSRLGKYTYGLYLLHPIAILICDIFFRLLKINTEIFTNSLLIGVASFFLSIFISYYSYHLVEKRFLQLKSRFSYIQSGNQAAP